MSQEGIPALICSLRAHRLTPTEVIGRDPDRQAAASSRVQPQAGTEAVQRDADRLGIDFDAGHRIAAAGHRVEQLGEQRGGQQARTEPQPRLEPLAFLVADTGTEIEQHDDEHEQHDDRAGVDHHFEASPRTARRARASFRRSPAATGSGTAAHARGARAIAIAWSPQPRRAKNRRRHFDHGIRLRTSIGADSFCAAPLGLPAIAMPATL